MMNRYAQFSGRGSWGGSTHADNILLFSKTTPPRVTRCLQRLAFQARPDCLTRQSRSAARSAHVGDQFHGEYQMQKRIQTLRDETGH